MDDLVKEYLDKAKASVAAEETKSRNKHLISLGLYHTERVYGPYGGKFLLYDKEQKRHYYEKKIPVEVTDEEYSEICKYASRNKVEEDIPEEPKVKEVSNSAERILGGFNTFLLCVNILMAIVVLIGVIATGEMMSVSMAVLVAVLIVAGAILVWATVKVCLNISNNLHEINAKMPE